MNSIEILEQAVDLLRGAPVSVIVTYFAGAVPFAIASLFFLNDMTRGAFASDHLAASSFALAALYVWKNVWQARFSALLYRVLSPGEPVAGNALRLIAMQSALQPVSLGAGLILMIPLPWMVAFFRNVGLFAALGHPDPIRAARKQAVLWTRQNWGILGLVTLGGLLLFANILIVIVILPQLGRSFLGIEGDLARLGARMLNLSSAGAAAALAWMAVDPLLDAVYVLRCYYGESIATGEDLLAALRRAIPASAAVAALAILLSPAARAQVDPARLDQSIDQVIHSREFTWRAPHPEAPESDAKWVSWIRAAERSIKRFVDWIGAIIRHLFDRLQPDSPEAPEAKVSRGTMEALIGVAVALVIGAGIFFFLQQRKPVMEAKAVPAVAAVNVADESVTADQLPESTWLALAQDLLARGETRLALRALYLAGLNYLSGRGLVSVTRWKSGLDYRRELERRARAMPEIGDEFAKLNGIFEFGWYGLHGVDRTMVDSVSASLAAIRTSAERIP